MLKAALATALLLLTATGAAAQGAGPNDKPAVDAAAADRGRKIYASECITCHGTQARGTDTGANLVRSVVVLRDRMGSELGPFLKKGHPLQTTKGGALTELQVVDVAHFLRQRVNDTLRGSPIFQVQNILTGDAKAGAAYFEGEGKCATCHSPSGNNLAGIGARYQPVDIQQRMLFPGSGRGGGRGGGRGAPAGGRGAAPAPNPNAVRVTVTPPGGQAISGVLVQMDDFLVSLRTDDGTPRTIRRVPGTSVVKTNPLAFHVELLDRITDTQMHDVVRYLETLK